MLMKIVLIVLLVLLVVFKGTNMTSSVTKCTPNLCNTLYHGLISIGVSNVDRPVDLRTKDGGHINEGVFNIHVDESANISSR